MRVNFEVGTSGGASAEDALRTLNTELVAGKGPDVLILDGMPLQSFIDKGVLAELSQVISADGLIPQVVDPMRTDGKLYAVPTRFTRTCADGKSRRRWKGWTAWRRWPRRYRTDQRRWPPAEISMIFSKLCRRSSARF